MKNLINKKLEDKEVNEFIKEFQLSRQKDPYLNAPIIFFQNAHKPIYLTLNKASEKVISVSFQKGKGDLSEALLNTELLFGVRFLDAMDEVISKIGKEPTLAHENKGEIVWGKVYHQTYYVDDTAIRIWFNADKEVVDFSYSEIDAYIKAHWDWQKSIQSQDLNKDIDITTLKKESPVSIWRERLRENERFKQQGSEEYIEDYWYSAERLDEVESMLDHYLEQLKKHCTANQPLEVEKAMRDVILAINDFNQTAYMIETDEREDLCPFFNKTIIATGLSLPDQFDPTLFYRDW